MLRRPLLALARSERLKELAATMPVSSGIVARFVAGESTADAVHAAQELTSKGLLVSLDHLGEDTTEIAQAEATVQAYLDVLRELSAVGVADRTEVSVKLSAVGQFIGDGGERIAFEHARRICQAAANVGTTVTLDMEDHTTTDSTLRVLHELRQDFPDTGAVLQAYLRRTEADCRALATTGSRVRLCKGAYKEPSDVAFTDRHDVDRSYVRCLKVLMRGDGYPMVASHDPRLVEIAGHLASENGRGPGDFEYQMLYGIRPDEQERLAAQGHTVRVYTPYGEQWYGYLMRRLAERPANVTFFARSLVSKG
ncbi:proline dehydrogenase family protein [Solicola sp. PLA-1-18]|uniref:proline dehydrogenase family protein n=1 Tax=Solicola sp. PLA-1-18 TaxID=3380532 RepID=UPI003B7AFCAE